MTADHPAIVERVKYSQLGVLSADLLARFFDVERVIIGDAQKNTAVEGQTDSMSYIWGKDALLAYVNPRLGKKTVSLGVTYQWKTRTTERLNGTDERDRRGQFIRVGAVQSHGPVLFQSPLHHSGSYQSG